MFSFIKDITRSFLKSISSFMRVGHPWFSGLEYETAALLAERVVVLLGEASHQNVLVLMLLTELHDLCYRLGHAHTMRCCLNAQLLDKLSLHLQTFLKLAHLLMLTVLLRNKY